MQQLNILLAQLFSALNRHNSIALATAKSMIYISTFNRFFHSDYIWNHIINWKFDTHTSDFRSFLVELFRRRDGNMKRHGKAMMDKWWLLFSIELFVYSILYTFLCSVMCARACASLGVQILRSGLQINRIKKHCNLGQRYTLPASTLRKPLCCTQKVTGFRDGVYCQRTNQHFFVVLLLTLLYQK